MRNAVRMGCALMLLAGLASPALAASLDPDAKAFITAIGLSPDAPDVLAVVDDQVGVYTLNRAAKLHDETAVREFIATRTYAHSIHSRDLCKPYGPHDYNVRYLSQAEVAFIGKTIEACYN